MTTYFVLINLLALPERAMLSFIVLVDDTRVARFTLSNTIKIDAVKTLLLIYFLGTLTQSIRNFAKSLESWLSTAMVDCPREITVIKVILGYKFAHFVCEICCFY